ncbi:MAG: hypothetical protein HYV16_02060 [Gammaproteobacteria bacterium]|nr:hypothetical protein [Gammaproteobacteria bacterium]
MNSTPQRRQTSYLWVVLVLFALTVKAVHACMLPALIPSSASFEQFGSAHAEHAGHAEAARHAEAGSTHAAMVAGGDAASCCEDGAEPVCGIHCAEGEQLKLGDAAGKAAPSTFAFLYRVAAIPQLPASAIRLLISSERPRDSATPPLTILYQVFTI